jgi:hypothetical protein
MSSQSIYIQTIDTVKEQLEKDILKQAKNFLLCKRFMLGKGINKKQRNHALMAMSYICTENCELIRYINKGLKGCAIETDLNSTYNMWKGMGNTGTKACFIQVAQSTTHDCLDVCWTEKEW